jgi:hypothetical protein
MLAAALTFFDQGLARAVYAHAPVTLLDDTFSALDAETEAHGEHTSQSAVLPIYGLTCHRSIRGPFWP